MFDSNDVRINQQETKCKESLLKSNPNLIPKILKNWCLEKNDLKSDLLHDPGGVIFAMWNHYIEVKKTVPNSEHVITIGRV